MIEQKKREMWEILNKTLTQIKNNEQEIKSKEIQEMGVKKNNEKRLK